MSEPTSNLYKILNSLHETDKEMWRKLSSATEDLSGQLVDSNTGKIADQLNRGVDVYSNDSLQLSAVTKIDFSGPVSVTPDVSDSSLIKVSVDEGKALTGSQAITVEAYDENTDQISLKVKSGEKVLAVDNDGLYSTVGIAKQTTPEAGYAATYYLSGIGGEQLGEKINILKDNLLSSVQLCYLSGDQYLPVDSSTPANVDRYLRFIFKVNGGDEPSDVYLNVNDLYDSYTGVSGINVNNNTNQISVKINSASSESFLTVTADGIVLSGVQNAINAKNQELSGEIYENLDDLSAILTGYSKTNTVSSAIAAIAGDSSTIKGITASPTIASSAFSGNSVTLSVLSSSAAGNAIDLTNGLYVKGIEAGDNISITENTSTGKWKITGTYTPQLAGADASASGVVYGGADVSITAGQITVNQATKVKKAVEIFDITYDGSASGIIEAGYGLSSVLNGTTDTISVDTSTIATRDYVEEVSMLVASAVASSGDLVFWTELSSLANSVSALYDEIHGE